MKKLVWFVCLVAASAMLPISVAHTQQNLPGAEAVPREIVVQFHPGASAMDKADARMGAEAARTRASRVNRPAGDRELLTVSGPVDVALEILRDHPAVLFAEPNFVFRHTLDANDPHYVSGGLWGMYGDDLPAPSGPPGTTNQWGSQAEKAWAAGHVGSDNVIVAVIDTGMQVTHPDLASNVWVNPFDPIDGIDNDGNGFIDDTNGWDFYRNDRTVFDADEHFHGTHVGGTVGAQGNNGVGVVGVNWNVTMISLKFLGPTGSGSLFDAAEAIDYLTDLKQRHNLNIVASNNSWGCAGCFSNVIETAIINGANEDILFVAAAGNSNNNNDVSPFYPASHSTVAGAGYEAVISVAAINDLGSRASFSNYGLTTVDLGAPGVSTLSTVPVNGYGVASGTSMASPHVAGAVALYRSMNPGATANQIRNAILTNATPTASLAGLTVTGGRLNIGNLLGGPPPGDVIDRLAFTDTVAGGCAVLKGKVILNAPAPSGGLVVQLSSANPAASVPSQVTVAEGKLKKSFNITTTAVALLTSGDITATHGVESESRTLNVRPIGVKSLALSPKIVVGGNNVTGTVKLECAAAPGPISVALASSKPNIANPTTNNLVFPAGVSSSTFQIATSAVSSDKTAAISASANGITKKKTLTVTP